MRDGDSGTSALLGRPVCDGAVVGCLLGCVPAVSRGPCTAAVCTVPLQIPRHWLPRYIRRSHIQRPWRPLSLQFNGKLPLKGLKSGIKAAVARLLAAGDAHERVRGAGAGAMAQSPAALPGLCRQ